MAGKVLATLVVMLLLLMLGSSQESPASTTSSTRMQWSKACVINRQIHQQRTTSPKSFTMLMLLLIWLRMQHNFGRLRRTTRRCTRKNVYVRKCDVRPLAHGKTSADQQAKDEFRD